MDGKELIRTASLTQTMIRAHSTLNRKIGYASVADAPPFPLDGTFPPAFDPIGYLCFSIGIPRCLPLASGQNLTYEAICAHGEPILHDWFDPVDAPQIGDLYVFPDHRDQGRWCEGHVALISRVGNGRILEALHCSADNVERTGDAIAITPFEHVPQHPDGRFMRIDYDFMKAHLGITEVAPRLVIGVPEPSHTGQFRHFKVRSARIEGDVFVVSPKEVATILGKSSNATEREPLRTVLTNLRVRYIADAEPLKDPEDPRAYVFIEK